jgi:DNA-binding PadR family transcriptional regulator
MLVKGWVSAQWKISANNRRARFYTLTAAGKKQLGVEESRFSQMFGAIMRVMKAT